MSGRATSRHRALAASAAFLTGAAVGFGLWLAGSGDLPGPRLDLAREHRAQAARPAEVRIDRPYALPLRVDDEWLAPEATHRQTIELDIVPPASVIETGHRPRFAEARLHLGLAELVQAARVFDASGAEVASRLEPGGAPGDYRLVFAPPKLAPGERFSVYYPAEPVEHGVSPEAEQGVEVTVHPGRIRQPRRLTTAAAYDSELAAFAPAGPPVRRSVIDDHRSPYGPETDYTAVYRSWLACHVGGRYELGIDADDEASVFIGGKRVLAGGMSSGVPQRDFPHTAAVDLEAGLHEIVVYHVQATSSLRMRLGWRPPDSETMSVVPARALRGMAVAQAVALDLRDIESEPPFFEARPTRRMTVNREVPLDLIRLAPRMPKGDYEVAWSDEDGPLEVDADGAVEVAVSGHRSAGGRRRVTLQLARGGRPVAAYTRDVALSADRDAAEPLSIRFDISPESTFVYATEPLRLALTAVNGSRCELPLEFRERRSGEAGTVVERVDLPGIPSKGRDDMAARTRSVVRTFGAADARRLRRASFSVGPAGAPVVEREVIFLGSRDELLPALRVVGGRARTADGALAIFVMPQDTEADLRRFAVVRALPSVTADRGLGLFFGESLASPGAEEGAGLLPGMRRTLGRMRIEHRPLPPGEPPMLAAVCAIDTALMEEDWGTIWISPGIPDIRHGTRIQTYERGLGFLIDRARRLRPDARLVIVGPPPEWLRTDVSSRYARAAESVARFRGVEYVDLHGLIMSDDFGGSAWTEGEDSVGFPYPVGAALRAAVRAVAGR